MALAQEVAPRFHIELSPALCGERFTGPADGELSLEVAVWIEAGAAAVNAWEISIGVEAETDVEIDVPPCDRSCLASSIYGAGADPSLVMLLAARKVDAGLHPRAGPLAGLGPQGPGVIASAVLRQSADAPAAILPAPPVQVLAFTVTARFAREAPRERALRIAFKDGLQAAGAAILNRVYLDGVTPQPLVPAREKCPLRLLTEGWIPGRTMPGDFDQSRRLDLHDGLRLLAWLFLDNTRPLPCGDGRISFPGNLDLLDATGDRRVDLGDAIALLSHVFLGGRPHVLGKDCAPILGCPASCGR
jgi:hypothetical protein